MASFALFCAATASAQPPPSASKAFEANQRVASELSLDKQYYIPIRLAIGGPGQVVPVLVCNPQLTDEQIARLNGSAEAALEALQGAYGNQPACLCVAAQYLVSARKYSVADLHDSLQQAERECAAVFRDNKDKPDVVVDGVVTRSPKQVAAEAAERQTAYDEATAVVERLFADGTNEVVLAGCGLLTAELPWPWLVKDLPAEIALATEASKTVNWPVLAALTTAHLARRPDASGPAAKWLLTAYFRSKWFFSTGRAGLTVDDLVGILRGLLPSLAQPLAESAASEAVARPVALPVGWDALGLDAPPPLPSDQRLTWLSPSGEKDAVLEGKAPPNTPGWAAYRSNHEAVARLGLKPADFARVVLPEGVALCTAYTGDDQTAEQINSTAREAYDGLSRDDEWSALVAGQYLFTVQDWDPTLTYSLASGGAPQRGSPDQQAGSTSPEAPAEEEWLRIKGVFYDNQGRAAVVLQGEGRDQTYRVGDRLSDGRNPNIRWTVQSIAKDAMVLSRQEGGRTITRTVHFIGGGGGSQRAAGNPRPPAPGSGGESQEPGPAPPATRSFRYAGAEKLADAAKRHAAVGEPQLRVLTLGAWMVGMPEAQGGLPTERSAARDEARLFSETSATAGQVGCRAALVMQCAIFLDPFKESVGALRWMVRQVVTSARVFGVCNTGEGGAPVYDDPAARTGRFFQSICGTALAEKVTQWADEGARETLSFPPTPEETKERPR